MVLLVAALYTVYQRHLQQKQEANNRTSNNYPNEASSSSDECLKDFQTAVTGGAWQLYQKAVLGCATGITTTSPSDSRTTSPIRRHRMNTTTTATDVIADAECCPPLKETVSSESEQPQQQQPDEPTTFDYGVRQEWWNAVYGPNFIPSNQPVQEVPRTGVGLAGIPSYSTYKATIPADCANGAQKVGVTISRLPLGLYVREVAPGSEAHVAGIPTKSVLVSFNGLPLLAEASRPALERLWQYEGYFSSAPCDNNSNTHDALSLLPEASVDPTSAPTTGMMRAAAADTSSGVATEPVIIEFIRKGKLFSVVLLSNPPWGITWAPCGNFPLVKRVYSFCDTAGVQRGSLVAAVNDMSVRDLDHAEAALAIRELFLSGQEIRLVFSYPPRKARGGERKKTSPRAKLTAKTHDGVEVKFHPWEQTIGSLCHAGDVHVKEGAETEWHVLAEQVAAGVKNAGPRHRRRLESLVRSVEAAPPFGPCPSLDQTALMQLWDPLDSLIFCLGMHHCNFDRELFAPTPCDASEHTRIERLRNLTSSPDGPAAAFSFVLPFISLICSPDNFKKLPDEEKKAEESSLPNGETPLLKTAGSELTAMLLKLSRRDEGFCQYLYFLLRSFISTFETRRPSTGGDRNLMALLHCLELLRFAEKELASRLLTGKPSVVRALSCPPSPERSKSLFESGPPSPLAASPGSPDSEEDSPAKKRSMLGFFRKKKMQNKSMRSKAPPPVPDRQASSARPPRRTSDSAEQSAIEITKSLSQSPSTMYENMSDFLSELDRICATIERSLQKSFRQKIAEWALQPWSASKDSALAVVTESMRESLRQANESSNRMLLVNPVESSELLSSVDYDECYILPSAHFPILLTFNARERRSSNSVVAEEILYRTTVELVSLRGSRAMNNSSYVVHAAVAGKVAKSGPTNSTNRLHHVWSTDNVLHFETRSSWGAPQTMSLRLSANSEVIDQRVCIDSTSEVGFCWVDLGNQWHECDTTGMPSATEITVEVLALDEEDDAFDEHGEASSEVLEDSGRLEVQLKIKTECLEFDDSDAGSQSRKRMLLYKHDDDLRQEAFAVQFIRTCDDILKASGLDMMLLTFQCIPVGTRRGFVEWVPGSVPLSEICQPFAGSLLAENRRDVSDDDTAPSMLAKAGLSKYESLRRFQHNESLRRPSVRDKPPNQGSSANNLVQDYLRSVAYDQSAPYMIRKDVMETYVKSCAGYCVITYILGVGDRHLDNLLLHQSGSFFHCDFSFILGNDPKKYLPMRITKDMVRGMGGRESDNYAKFLSLAGAAFLVLRYSENVRVLLSMVRLMETALLPDVTEHQSIQEAILGVRNRLRLDLSEEQALTFMEELVESSLSSRMWMAVDAIHNLGKKIKL